MGLKYDILERGIFRVFIICLYDKKLWFSLIVYLHPGLTRVSSILFLLFEIKRVLVYNSTIIYFTDLFILYFFIQNAYTNKKYLRKKASK